MTANPMTATEKPQQSFLGKRFEFKYQLSPIEAARVEEELNLIGFERDNYSKKSPYLVNSLYFDTPTLGDYRDKDGSFLIRKKMRARTYEDNWYENPEHIWLEIKKKRNMNIAKSRFPINQNIWRSLINPHTTATHIDYDGTPEDTAAFKEFIYFYSRQLYAPQVIVKYRRTAYLSTFTNPIRITFDRNVVACRTDSPLDEKCMTPVTQNQVIMEVKFNHKLPWWFRHIIEKYDLQRDDFSKYRNAVAILRGYNRIPVDK